MIPSRFSACLPVFALLLFLGACSALPQVTPYRIAIQQGNWITQDMVSRLKPGMTKDQVRFALGTPLLIDPFHLDRWDYVFIRSPENSTVYDRRRITVHFADGKLLRVDGDVVSGGDASGKAAQSTPAAPSIAAKPSAPLPVVNQ